MLVSEFQLILDSGKWSDNMAFIANYCAKNFFMYQWTYKKGTFFLTFFSWSYQEIEREKKFSELYHSCVPNFWEYLRFFIRIKMRRRIDIKLTITLHGTFLDNSQTSRNHSPIRKSLYIPCVWIILFKLFSTWE